MALGPRALLLNSLISSKDNGRGGVGGEIHNPEALTWGFMSFLYGHAYSTVLKDMEQLKKYFQSNIKRLEMLF